MSSVAPSSAEALAGVLEDAAERRQTISVVGNNSKRLMGGPVLAADITVSTRMLNNLVQYEPNDLTVSVQAGMSFAGLQEKLARNRQMIALDPPFAGDATVGGVVAANASGSMRRGFGTLRDFVIGMQFATLEGKLVSAGGMVVKNVAGLDLTKLMIGSFGTLAVITTVNFRLHPLPERTQTFLFSHPDLQRVLEKRNEILQGVLRPMCLDILSPPAAARLGARGYVLALRAGGSERVLARYRREFANAENRSGNDDASWWNQLREFTAEFIRRQPNGIVLCVSTKLSDIGLLLKLSSAASVSHAGSGVTRLYLNSWQSVAAVWRAAIQKSWAIAVEFAPDEMRASKELWLSPAPSHNDETFTLMKKIKQMFDPDALLNRGRLYARI